MSDVFISYSTDAKPWAERLCEYLERKGVSTWTDFKSIRPGQRWLSEIQRALDEATYFLIVVGPKNRIGEWQDREWQGALQHTWNDPQKRIIPVLVDDAEAPASLQSWVSVRVQPGKPESSWIDPIYDIVSGTASEGDGRNLKRNATPDKALRTRLGKLESAAKQLKLSQEHSG